MGEGQKGQQRNDGRRSKLEQGQRQLMALPSRGVISGTGVGHLQPMATSSLFSHKEVNTGGLKYGSRRHIVTEIRREIGRGGRQLCCCMQTLFLSHNNSCVQRIQALQRMDVCKPKGAKSKKKNKRNLALEGISFY